VSRPRSRALATIGVLAVACGAAAGCGGGSDFQQPAQLALINTQSAWVPGEPSLLANTGFRGILAQSIAEAFVRQQARDLELARLAAAQKAAEARAKAAVIRAYREALRKAREAYQQALREAALQRRIQAERLAAAKRKRARELAALRRKLQVKPGQECTLPQVAVYFICRKGMTPLPKPLPKG
jgi:hypothetical protein